MIPGEPTAAQKVRKFLDLKATMNGVDQALVHTVAARGEVAELTVADLRTLVMQAEALQHMAPHAAQCIEVGPS